MGWKVPKPPVPKYEPIGINGQPSPVVGATSDAAAPFDWQKFATYLKGEREKDLAQGQGMASKYFDTPEMKALIDIRKHNVDGMSGNEQLALREQGMAGINAQLGTGMRALRGQLGASGVRGGAAAGAAIPMLMQSNAQRGTLERDIQIKNEEAKRGALDAYERTLTGERAGKLGTMFGYAGLGAGDRSGAMQYGLGQDYMKYAQEHLKKLTSGGAGDGPVDTTVSPGNAMTSIFGRNPQQGMINFASVLGGPYTALANYGYQKANGTDADPRTWWD